MLELSRLECSQSGSQETVFVGNVSVTKKVAVDKKVATVVVTGLRIVVWIELERPVGVTNPVETTSGGGKGLKMPFAKTV